MTKTELKKIMRTYCIIDSELDDVFSFVADVLYARRQELEKNEPYATRTIDDLLKAEIEVDSLMDYINELEA